MALTNQQMLDLIDGVLQGRSDGDFYNKYTEALVNKFEGETVFNLNKMRLDYAKLVTAGLGSSYGAGAPAHYLAEPFDPGIG